MWNLFDFTVVLASAVALATEGQNVSILRVVKLLQASTTRRLALLAARLVCPLTPLLPFHPPHSPLPAPHVGLFALLALLAPPPWLSCFR